MAITIQYGPDMADYGAAVAKAAEQITRAEREQAAADFRLRARGQAQQNLLARQSLEAEEDRFGLDLALQRDRMEQQSALDRAQLDEQARQADLRTALGMRELRSREALEKLKMDMERAQGAGRYKDALFSMLGGGAAAAADDDRTRVGQPLSPEEWKKILDPANSPTSRTAQGILDPILKRSDSKKETKGTQVPLRPKGAEGNPGKGGPTRKSLGVDQDYRTAVQFDPDEIIRAFQKQPR